jgi:hypothetical protein
MHFVRGPNGADNAVVGLEVCYDYGRHFAGAVCDCDAAVSGCDAQALGLIDWFEVVGTCGEITSHQDAVIYVVQQDVSQLAFVFWQQQCFDRALWQGVKGSIYGRVSRECTWARERVSQACRSHCRDQSREAFIAGRDFCNGPGRSGRSSNRERGRSGHCFQMYHDSITFVFALCIRDTVRI